MMKYKTIDLCAGIGGIRRGFELTGRFENVLSAEIDLTARRTYEHLYGEKPEEDLTSNDFKNLVAHTQYDVLLAGFPCQAFSAVGLKRGFEDKTKGTIFFHIVDIIRRNRPKALLLENVQNLLSHDKGKTLKTILDTLVIDNGYKIVGVDVQHLTDGVTCVYSRRSFLRNSRDFGVPQNRPRIYIMAFDARRYSDRALSMIPTSLPISRRGNPIFRDVRDVLESQVDDHYYMSSKYLETLEKHKSIQHDKGNGFGYAIVNEERPGNPILVSNTILATGGSGKERNLVRQHKDGISGKVISSKGSPLNSKGIRVMTPVEWGRLQGFVDYAFKREDGSDGFSFPQGVSEVQQYKQLGNSVTIPVIEEMAKFMVKCLDAMTPLALKDDIVKIAETSGQVSRMAVITRLNIEGPKAGQLLHELVTEGRLVMHGSKWDAFYTTSIKG